MWKCGYKYLRFKKKPTLQIREHLVNIWFRSVVSCSFLNASIHFLWTLNYTMTECRVILLTANFSIWKAPQIPHTAVVYSCTTYCRQLHHVHYFPNRLRYFYGCQFAFNQSNFQLIVMHMYTMHIPDFLKSCQLLSKCKCMSIIRTAYSLSLPYL